MRTLIVLALCTGVCFGLWPIFMNRSGLAGFVSAAAFALGVLAFTSIPALFALRNGSSLAGTNWTMVVTACILGGVGLLFFNSGLAKASPQTVGSFFLAMIMVQIAVPVIYQAVMTGGMLPAKAAGVAAAIIAAILLV